jgi:hypothetical protein
MVGKGRAYAPFDLSFKPSRLAAKTSDKKICFQVLASATNNKYI